MPGIQRFEIMTDAVDQRGFFDPRYTCDIDNSSPELRWSDPQAQGVAGFALVMEDPDARGISEPEPFSHWVVYQIPGNIRHLPAGIPPQETLPNGIRQGVNGFGKLGYAGPCPPIRHTAHRYVFRLFALSQHPEIPSRPSREELLHAIRPFIVAMTEYTGRYQRIVQKAG